MRGVKQIGFILLTILVWGTALTQNDPWVLVQQYPIGTEEVWKVDGVGNVIITRRDQLTKYGPDGTVLFEQSQKSFGRIQKIQAFNTLKFVCFSEQQQTLCFFDNSLTALEKCVELADYDILNATHFATSGQSDKLWVFDQVNSTLRLLSLNGLNQDQSIKNLGGIINSDRIEQLIEIENNLFFVDPESGVFMFDLYGTLLMHIKMPGVHCIQFKSGNLLMLVGNQLIVRELQTGNELQFDIPVAAVKEFYFDASNVFFRTDTEILKYHFLLD